MAQKLIGILGSFSGNNAGDSALLESTMATILAVDPEVRFLVPSSQPAFVKSVFAHYPVSVFPIRVRYGSAKFWGIPAFYPFLRCNALVTTGSLLFDRKLLDPFFNVLIPWSIQIPLAKRLGKIIVGYNIGIGPLHTQFGKRLARRILSHMDRIVIREPECETLLNDWKLHDHVVHGADTALALPLIDDAFIEAELSQMNITPGAQLIGFNMSSVSGMFQQEQDNASSGTDVITLIAEALQLFMREHDVTLIGLVTNELDRHLMRTILQRLPDADRVRITRQSVSHSVLTGLFSRCELVIGSRLHAIVFSASSMTPVVCLSYAPKVSSFMRSIGLESWITENYRVNSETFSELLRSAWRERAATRAHLTKVVPALKDLARRAGYELVRLLHEQSTQ